MKIRLVCILTAFSLCFFGCAKSPAEEMENTRNAVSNAENDAGEAEVVHVERKAEAENTFDVVIVESDFQASVLKEEIDDTSRNVAGAQYSQLVLDYNELERSLIKAYNTLDQAQNDSAAGRHQDAMNKAGVIRADLYDINQMVANAAARGRKK